MGYNKAFLIFRLRQTGKFVRDIPVLYLLVLSGMLVMLVYAIHDFMKEPDRAILSGIIFLGLIGILHVRRGDYHFIQLVEERPARIYCMDYCLLVIPLCLIGTLRGFYWISFFMLSGCWLISKIKQPVRHIGKGITLPRFIPEDAFECKAGIRKNGIILLLIYTGGYAVSWLPYVSFIFLWLFTCVIGDFFYQAEPLTILCVKELPARHFLSWKIKMYIRLYLSAMVPPCLLYTLLHPADWIAGAFFLLSGTMNIVLMILSKYASYTPDMKIRAGQIANGLSLLGMILPFLTPLTLFLLLKKYPASCHNLKTYLYAYN